MALFTNQATLSYSGGVTNSNITSGELVESVTLEKSAVSASYSPGETIAYAISIANNGATALNALTVTDDLGAYLFGTQTVYPLSYREGSLVYLVDGVRQSLPVVETAVTSPPLTVTGINIPAGSNVTLIYEAAVTPYAPLGAGAEITNTVTVTGAAISLMTAQATVPMEGDPRLTISKCASAEQVSMNGELGYSFLIQNADGIWITTPGVSVLSVTGTV